MRNNDLKNFLGAYNELLSKAALEHKGKFAALASPTLNKQETITFLYRDVVKYVNGEEEKIAKPNPVLLRLKFIARMGLMFIRLVKTSLMFRIKTIPYKCIYVNTWLEPRCVRGEVLRDDFFRELINDLKNLGTTVVSFNVTDYHLLKRIKKITVPENYIISIGLLRFWDIVKIIAKYITTAKIKLKRQYVFKNIDVSQIINLSLSKDYYKLRSFHAFLYLCIAEKIKKFRPSSFFYVFENQSWENSYLYVFKNTSTKTIGYQSSGFSLRYLNFFPTKIDAQNSLFPDLILTVGEHFTNILKKYGNYPILLKTFGALRFEYPVYNGKYKINSPSKHFHNRLLYAFSVSMYQYAIIINALIEIFKDSPIEVHLKFHPQHNINKLNKMFSYLPKNFFIINDISAEKLSEKYDCVIFNDNSFGIEALLNSVKVYEFDTDEVWDESRLFYFDGYDYKTNKIKLSELRDIILDGNFRHFEIKDLVYNEYYINKLYTPYTMNSFDSLKKFLFVKTIYTNKQK